MPNHIHFLIFLQNKNHNLIKIIRAFKSFTNKEYRDMITNNGRCGNRPYEGALPELWQKSFYDHVIRNEHDLQRLQEYIYFNPLSWHLDSLNPENKTLKTENRFLQSKNLEG